MALTPWTTGVSSTAAENSMTQSGERGQTHDVEIGTLDLRATNGTVVSLKALFVDMNFSVSVFEHHIEGTITLFDGVGLINRLPIVGEEYLDVSFNTPGNAEKRGTFRVWRVTNEEAARDGNESTYTLHFCSPEVFANAHTWVRRSFRNTDDAASILGSILTQDLRAGKTFNSAVMKDPAKCLVVPFLRPFDAIDMLLRRGYEGNRSKSDYFLFFERWDGYWLRMYDDLVAKPINRREQGQGTPNPSQPGSTPDTPVQNVETWYVYASDKYADNTGRGDNTEGRDIRRVLSLQIHRRFDSLAKISDGLYENETVYYSIVNKGLESRTFNHARDGMLFLGGAPDPFRAQGKVGSTGAERMNSDEFVGEFTTLGGRYAWESASRVFTRLRHEEEKEGVDKKAGGLYWSVRQALDQVRLTITVPGDTMVDAGDVVHLEVPRFDATTSTAQPDKFLSGKWLVASLTDSILATKHHTMTLDLVRDAFWQKPGEADFTEDYGQNQTQAPQ